MSDSNCLSPKGEFWNRLEQALDLSKNVLDEAKRDLGNSLLRFVLKSEKKCKGETRDEFKQEGIASR